MTMHDDDSRTDQKDGFPFFRFAAGFILGACLTGYFCLRWKWIASMPGLAIAIVLGGGVGGIATMLYGDAAWHWLIRK